VVAKTLTPPLICNLYKWLLICDTLYIEIALGVVNSSIATFSLGGFSKKGQGDEN